MASGEATGPLACAVERDRMRETDRADGRLKTIALIIFAEMEKKYGAKQTAEN